MGLCSAVISSMGQKLMQVITRIGELAVGTGVGRRLSMEGDSRARQPANGLSKRQTAWSAVSAKKPQRT